MKRRRNFRTTGAAMVAALSGCGSMSKSDRRTAAGAAVGGVIGHEVAKDKK